MKNEKSPKLSTLLAIIGMTVSLSVFAQQTTEVQSYDESCPTYGYVTASGGQQIKARLSYVLIRLSNRSHPNDIYICYYHQEGSFYSVISKSIPQDKKIKGFTSEQYSKSDKCDTGLDEPCTIRIVPKEIPFTPINPR
jgi:hypothetical protein